MQAATTSIAGRPAYALEVLCAAAVYFATARLGLDLAVVAKQVSVIWPATGLALALLVLRGRRLWPAIFLGAFAANYLGDTPLLAAAGIASGNTIEALLGATLLRRVEFRPAMRRLHDVASLFLLAACLSTISSATVGVISMCLTGTAPWSAFSSVWSTWWIGDAIGDLVTAPLLFVWADQARNRWRLQRLTEAALLLCSMLLLSLAVFVDHGSVRSLPGALPDIPGCHLGGPAPGSTCDRDPGVWRNGRHGCRDPGRPWPVRHLEHRCQPVAGRTLHGGCRGHRIIPRGGYSRT